MFDKSELMEVMEVILDYCEQIDNGDKMHRKSCDWFDKLFIRLREAGCNINQPKRSIDVKYYRECIEFTNAFILKEDTNIIEILLLILKDFGIDIYSKKIKKNEKLYMNGKSIIQSSNISKITEDIVKNLNQSFNPITEISSKISGVGEGINQSFKPITEISGKISGIGEGINQSFKPIIGISGKMTSLGDIVKDFNSSVQEEIQNTILESKKTFISHDDMIVSKPWCDLDISTLIHNNCDFEIGENIVYKKLDEIHSEIQKKQKVQTGTVNIVNGDNNQIAVGNYNNQESSIKIEKAKNDLECLIKDLNKLEVKNESVIKELELIKEVLCKKDLTEEEKNECGLKLFKLRPIIENFLGTAANVASIISLFL